MIFHCKHWRIRLSAKAFMKMSTNFAFHTNTLAISIQIIVITRYLDSPPSMVFHEALSTVYF